MARSLSENLARIDAIIKKRAVLVEQSGDQMFDETAFYDQTLWVRGQPVGRTYTAWCGCPRTVTMVTWRDGTTSKAGVTPRTDMCPTCYGIE